MRSLIFLSTLLSAACSDDGSGDGDADSDSDVDTDIDSDSDADCLSDPNGVDLTGVWGVQATLQQRLVEQPESIVHLCPDGATLASSTLYLRVEIAQGSHGTTEQTVSVCDIEFPVAPGSVTPCDEDPQEIPITIALGEELAAIVPTMEFPGVGTVGVADGCVTYLPEDFVLILGTTLPAGDRDTALPLWEPNCTGTQDECVSGWELVADDDGDGKPGVTLLAESEVLEGEAYVTFRTVPVLAGRVLASDTMVGSVTPTLEYSFVGTDITLSGLPLDTPTVLKNLPSIEQVEEGSEFIGLRADDWGGASCQDILDHRNDFNG